MYDVTSSLLKVNLFKICICMFAFQLALLGVSDHIWIAALNGSLPYCRKLQKETSSFTEILLITVTSFIIKRSTRVTFAIFR